MTSLTKSFLSTVTSDVCTGLARLRNILEKVRDDAAGLQTSFGPARSVQVHLASTAAAVGMSGQGCDWQGVGR